MKNLLRKLLFVLSLVAAIGVNVFAQSSIVAKPACAGDDITFTVSIDPVATKSGSIPHLTWNFGDKSTDTQDFTTTVETVTNSHSYNSGNTYNVALTITYTGGTAPDEVVNKTIQVYKRPNASYYFGDHKAACAGKSVELAVNAYGNSVLWSTGATTEKINVKTAGMYKAVIYNAQLCTAGVGADPSNPTGEVEVEFFNYPEIADFGDIEYNRTADGAGVGEPITVNQVNNTYTDAVIEYSWNPSTSVRKQSADLFYVTPEKTMTYLVTADQTHSVAGQGNVVCSAQRQVTVNVIVINGNESTPFGSNNVFMPGSVNNNVWMMNGDNELKWYKDCKLIIYNVWGQEVYVADKIGEADYIWDGTSNDGAELPADTYYYLVQCSNCNCEPNPQKNEWTGTVTIIRK